MSIPTQHPAWCERQHADTYPAHSALVGEVELAEAELTVDLFQHGDTRPTIWLTTHQRLESVVWDLTADQARTLAAALTAAADALAGGAL